MNHDFKAYALSAGDVRSRKRHQPSVLLHTASTITPTFDGLFTKRISRTFATKKKVVPSPSSAVENATGVSNSSRAKKIAPSSSYLIPPANETETSSSPSPPAIVASISLVPEIETSSSRVSSDAPLTSSWSSALLSSSSRNSAPRSAVGLSRSSSLHSNFDGRARAYLHTHPRLLSHAFYSPRSPLFLLGVRSSDEHVDVFQPLVLDVEGEGTKESVTALLYKRLTDASVLEVLLQFVRVEALSTEEGEHGEGPGGGAAVYFVAVDDADISREAHEKVEERRTRVKEDFSIVVGREVGCLVLVSESFVAIRLSGRAR